MSEQSDPEYTCDTCGKGFNDARTLATHMNMRRDHD